MLACSLNSVVYSGHVYSYSSCLVLSLVHSRLRKAVGHPVLWLQALQHVDECKQDASLETTPYFNRPGFELAGCMHVMYYKEKPL